jgi:RNA ligase
MTHPARSVPFDELFLSLQAAHAEKLVNVGVLGPLRIYSYSDSCVYDRKWDNTTLAARGLILDVEAKQVVATPFPKFFNVGEGTQTIPDLPFETFEKLDGSLIILFYHAGEWKTATKGSLSSTQAKWAKEWFGQYDLSTLNKSVTYLFEAIYPENRIVVHYPFSGCVLLAAYHEAGVEIPYGELFSIAYDYKWEVAKRHQFAHISELLELAKTLPATAEGFVLRFSNGLRLKVKGDEYCRIHRLVSRLTPLAMWEAMMAGDDLEEIRKQLPEEFWADFDTIIALLSKQRDDLIEEATTTAKSVETWSDKEVGLNLEKFPEKIRRFIFPYRKNKGNLLQGRTRELLFKTFRPDFNHLKGYSPSTSMNRVFEEI